MKILIGHNYYQQPGGEDAVFRSHAAMLKQYGHEIRLYERRNDEIKPDPASRISHALSLRWSKISYDQMSALLEGFKPDIAHFHNVFYVMTPSVLHACKNQGVKVVVSLHNFRLMCLNGLFFRDGRPCEDCLTGSRVSGIIHRCYRGSLPFSIMAADMTGYHWRRRTWQDVVDCFVVATEFTKKKYVQAGLPEEKIKVLPHFLEQPAVDAPKKGPYALYAGRLSTEKGIDLLLDAWADVKGIPLYIVGGGPKQREIEEAISAKKFASVKFLGFLDSQEYHKVLAEAKFLVVPSICYENFPRVVVEAYAHGVPVVANRLGTMEEVVEDGVTGLLFSANDSKDLAARAMSMVENQEMYAQLCANTCRAYELRYTPAKHYEALMKIYEET